MRVIIAEAVEMTVVHLSAGRVVVWMHIESYKSLIQIEKLKNIDKNIYIIGRATKHGESYGMRRGELTPLVGASYTSFIISDAGRCFHCATRYDKRGLYKNIT